MDRGARGHDLLGVEVALRFLSEKVPHRLPDHREPGRPSHEDHGVQIRGQQPRRAKRLLAHLEGAVGEILREAGKFRPGDGPPDPLHLRLVPVEVRDIDGCRLLAAQGHLGLLGGGLEFLKRDGIAPQVDSVLRHEPVRQVIEQAVVVVLAAQEGVTGRGEHLEDVLSDLHDRDVEGPAAQVIDGDLPREIMPVAVGQRGGRRLVDDAEHAEPRDSPGVLRSLTLVVVEVGRHRDDGALHGAAKPVLRDPFHLAEDQRADLGNAVYRAVHLDTGVAVGARHDQIAADGAGLLDLVGVVQAPDQALRRKDRVPGELDQVFPGNGTDDDVSVLGEGDNAGRDAFAPLVGEHDGDGVQHGADARGGSPEVDPDGKLFAGYMAEVGGHDGFP